MSVQRGAKDVLGSEFGVPDSVQMWTIGGTLPKPTKFAAGGLVERRMNGGVRLAIVRRTRYGDWVLPKGKPDGNETIEETAIREVREETGCDVRIVGDGHSIEYFVGRALKVVTFFRMEHVADDYYKIDPFEIEKVVWLQPEEALARLTYESERSIVREAYQR
jgi:8-oxo-dGTP diphosphatase